MKRVSLVLWLFFIVANMGAQVPPNGLLLWLQADKGTKLRGSKLVSWADQSGNKHDAVTKTNDLPQLVMRAINGQPALRFNGNNNGMETAPFISFPNKRGTLCMVLKINGRSNTSGVGVGNLLSTFHGQGTVWQFCASPGKFSYYDGRGSEGFIVSSSAQTGWTMVTLLRRNDTIMDIYGGGRREGSFPIDNNQPAYNTLKIGFNGRLGGTATDSIPEVLNGDIAEIILYDRALDEDALQEIHTYLSKKYALALKPPPLWQRWWFYALLLVLAASIVLAIVLLINQRRLKKQLAILEKEQQMDRERQRISREMHDDIGAGLTQITLMSESAKNKGAGSSTKELDDIAETGRRLVSSMSEIIWSLNPENKTLEQLMVYLREQLNKQLEYAGMEYDLQLTDKGKDITLTNEQRRNLLLVTKEMLNNAIKYSRATHISISIQLDKHTLYGSVQDNGCGFDPLSVHTGNGLRNIRHRIGELGGILDIHTEKGRGSSFRFTIPL